LACRRKELGKGVKGIKGIEGFCAEEWGICVTRQLICFCFCFFLFGNTVLFYFCTTYNWKIEKS